MGKENKMTKEEERYIRLTLDIKKVAREGKSNDIMNWVNSHVIPISSLPEPMFTEFIALYKRLHLNALKKEMPL